MPSYRSPSAISQALAVLVLTLATLVIGSSLLGYALFHYRILFQDEWSFYKRLIEQPFWQGLWTSYDGHRLVFPGLLQHANLAWFNANLTNLIIVSLLAQIFSAWLLAYAVTHILEFRFSRSLLTVLVLCIMTWIGNETALVWAFGLTYTLGILGVVVACYCLFRSGGAAEGVHWPWLCSALVGALLASLSWGSGVVVWPILVLMGLALRLPRKAILAVLAIGVVVVIAYLIPAPGDTGLHIAFPTKFADIGNVLGMMLGVLGSLPTHLLSPFTTKGSVGVIWFARATGMLALALLVWLIALWWRRRSEKTWLLPPLGIALFVVGTAFLIGLARTNAEIRFHTWITHHATAFGLTDRYRIFSSLLWAALLCGIFPIIDRRIKVSLQRPFWAAGAFVLLLALLPSQTQDFIRAGLTKKKAEEAVLVLVTGTNYRAPIRLNLSFFHPKLISHFVPYLNRHRLTVFRQPWTHWEGTELGGVVKTETTIPGRLIDSGHDKDGWWIKGCIGTAHRSALVVGVDRQERIRGIAKLTRPLAAAQARQAQQRPTWLHLLQRVDPRLPAILGWGRGWYGFVPHQYNPHRLRYFLVTRDKRIIARIKP